MTRAETPTPISELFGEVIYAYTRAQAIEDGNQVSLNELHPDEVNEAGLKFPMYMTSTVYLSCVCPVEGEGEALAPCQDPKGRLWDVFTMLVHAIRGNSGASAVNFEVMIVPNIPEGSRRHPRAKIVKLVCQVGPVDMDDPRPAMTIMFPGED